MIEYFLNAIIPYILEQFLKNKKHTYLWVDFSLDIEEKYPLIYNVNSFQILLRHELVVCFTKFWKGFSI